MGKTLWRSLVAFLFLSVSAFAGDVGLIYSVTAPLTLTGSNIGVQTDPSFPGTLSTTSLSLAQIATPSNPASLHNRLYFKSDNHLYELSSAGVETQVDGGGGGGGTWGSITGTLSSQTDLATALGLKAPLASPNFSGTIGTPLTASRAMVTDSSGNLAISATTAAEIAFVSGLSSSVQTQLNAKQATLTLPLAIGSGGSGQATALAAFNAFSPLTTLGDILYGGASGSGTRLAGNTTSTKKFLTQTGTGTISAAPAYSTIASTDLPVPGVAALGGVFSKAAVTSNFLTSISSSDGSVGQAQPAFSDISGSVAASQLPNPSSTTLGGVRSAVAVSNQWINSISTSGIPALSQPAFTDISGSVAASQLPNPSSTTLGGIRSAVPVSNQWINSISTLGIPALSQPAFTDISGSVAASQLPNPSSTTLGGTRSAAAVTSQWINSISTSGIPALSQPAFTDISGSVAASQLPNPSSSTLGGVRSIAAVSHQWINTISTSGVPALTQPAFSDISGSWTVSQFNSGTSASSSTFARGDGVWAAPPGAVSNSTVLVNGCSGVGSNASSKIQVFPTVVTNTGSSITYGSSSTAGDTFTINDSGIYGGEFCFSYTTGGTYSRYGISVNQPDLTVFIGSVPAANLVAMQSTTGNTSNVICLPFLRWFTAADVLRANISTAFGCYNAADVYFRIVRLL